MLNLITNRGENVCGHAVALQSAFRTIMQSTVLFFSGFDCNPLDKAEGNIISWFHLLLLTIETGI